MLPSVQVDRGAIKFVLSGANVMAPGLVSAGGKLPDPSQGEEPIKEGQCVAIRAQGKDEILAVGVMKMASEEIRKTGKGIAIENIHYLGGEFNLGHSLSRCPPVLLSLQTLLTQFGFVVFVLCRTSASLCDLTPSRLPDTDDLWLTLSKGGI